MVNPETAHKLFQPLQIIYTEFIQGRVNTKKLGDVVAIRPEFFKDRLQKSQIVTDLNPVTKYKSK